MFSTDRYIFLQYNRARGRVLVHQLFSTTAVIFDLGRPVWAHTPELLPQISNLSKHQLFQTDETLMSTVITRNESWASRLQLITFLLSSLMVACQGPHATINMLLIFFKHPHNCAGGVHYPG